MTSLAFVAAMILSAQSAPGVEALRPTFTNTLVSTYPDGRQALLWLSADGSYVGRTRNGSRSSGVWQVDDGELCMRQRRPVPVPVRYCTPIVRGDVGVRWQARSVTGEPITIELRAGRGG
jgi:hypothetical protein